MRVAIWIVVVIVVIGISASESVDSDTVFLVSHPKSGSTWLRFLLACATAPAPLKTAQVQRWVDAAVLPSARATVKDSIPYQRMRVADLPRPLVAKSHKSRWRHRPFWERLDDSSDPLNNAQPVIYVLRDGRDVYESSWAFVGDRKGRSLERFVLDILAAGRWDDDMSRAPDRPAWGVHVASWLAGRDYRTGRVRREPSGQAHLRAWERQLGLTVYPGDVLVVRYEDLMADTAGELVRVVRFLDEHSAEQPTRFSPLVDEHPGRERLLRRAVQCASIDTLRAIEKEGAFDHAGTEMFRHGRVGRWRETYTPAMVHMMQASVDGDVLVAAGYASSYAGWEDELDDGRRKD